MKENMIAESSQYLTFTLNGGVFALDIGSVREVLEMTTITRVPRAPAFMRGIIHLRGQGVPVVDMRRKFGMPEVEQTVDTCIIIIEARNEGEVTLLGALVDSVREVVELPMSELLPPPRMGGSVDAELLRGMGAFGEEFVLILDPEKVFTFSELRSLKADTQADDKAA